MTQTTTKPDFSDFISKVAEEVGKTKINFRTERLITQYVSWVLYLAMVTFILLRVITSEKRWRRAALWAFFFGMMNNFSGKVQDAVIVEQERLQERQEAFDQR